jgi:hypothetical protein
MENTFHQATDPGRKIGPSLVRAPPAPQRKKRGKYFPSGDRSGPKDQSFSCVCAASATEEKKITSPLNCLAPVLFDHSALFLAVACFLVMHAN